LNLANSRIVRPGGQSGTRNSKTKTLTADQPRPLFERDPRTLKLLKRSAQPANQRGDCDEDSLELKLISLMHLCQAWTIRRWILSQYSTVEEYLNDLEPIALGVMRATRGRKARKGITYKTCES
jgi:hypothetical protein